MRRSRPHPSGRLCAGGVLAASVATGLTGCGSTGLTAPRLQGSIAQTFANLYVLQQRDQGHSPPAVDSLAPRASCAKGTPDTTQSGAGADWVCTVTFFVAGPATPVNAVYDVNLRTDGCYSADGDGPASVNGSRTVTGPGYRQLVNPLWRMDGCFDIG